ncbi:MAG: hypothetical protein LBI43_02625 [Streptococcaceae bacterium]|jgi:drug/metabolite transporter (DMT)-like permease|nr:hypothetical protein [Streptococcaceae bacterium]
MKNQTINTVLGTIFGFFLLQLITNFISKNNLYSSQDLIGLVAMGGTISIAYAVNKYIVNKKIRNVVLSAYVILISFLLSLFWVAPFLFLEKLALFLVLGTIGIRIGYHTYKKERGNR